MNVKSVKTHPYCALGFYSKWKDFKTRSEWSDDDEDDDYQIKIYFSFFKV